MTRLVVTGASGLLGYNVVRAASGAFDVFGVVHAHRIAFEKAEVRQVDLTEETQVKDLVQEIKPDWVIHCAAGTAIDELERDPGRADELNVHMSRRLARAVADSGARLLYVSTDSVFDGSAGPYREDDETNPINVYARSKLEGEQAVMDELPGALVARTNLFGWSPGWKLSLAEWFYQNLSSGRECPGFTDVYFSPVYAPELGKIFLRMLNEKLEGIYHVPGAECVSKYDFGVRLALKFGLQEELVVPTLSAEKHWVAERPRRTCLDGAKIVGALGIDLPDLNDGIVHFRADMQEQLVGDPENPPDMEVSDE